MPYSHDAGNENWLLQV